MMTVRAAQRRVTRTPNATMTTYASPSVGGSSVRVWQVDMPARQIGPRHAFVDEVAWTITDGGCAVWVDGDATELEAGDTVVLPGGVQRRFVAGEVGFTALVSTAGTGEVRHDDGSSAGVPAWVQ